MKSSTFKFKRTLCIFISIFIIVGLFSFLVYYFFGENAEKIFLFDNGLVVDNSEEYFKTEDFKDLQASLAEQGLFYYSQLSEKEKKSFNYVYMAIKKRASKVVFSEPLTIDFLTKIVYILKFDCPEMYFLGNNIDYDLKGKNVLSYYPTYDISQRKYSDMQNTVSQKEEEILEMVEGLSEYDTELYIHNYILKNTEYTTKTSNCDNLYGCIIEGKANCEGYSAAFTYLLRRAGIESSQVIGETTGEKSIGHSWNIVKIDGIYSYVDVSWDDLEDSSEYNDIDYHYAFFNITYNEVSQKRDISKNSLYLGALPEENSVKNNFFYKNGTYIFKQSDISKIINEKLPILVSSNDKYLMLKCNGSDMYEVLVKEIKNIMQDTIKQKKLPISNCSYIKIADGYTIIIHNIKYNASSIIFN